MKNITAVIFAPEQLLLDCGDLNARLYCMWVPYTTDMVRITDHNIWFSIPTFFLKFPQVVRYAAAKSRHSQLLMQLFPPDMPVLMRLNAMHGHASQKYIAGLRESRVPIYGPATALATREIIRRNVYHLK